MIYMHLHTLMESVIRNVKSFTYTGVGGQGMFSLEVYDKFLSIKHCETLSLTPTGLFIVIFSLALL